MRIEIQTCDGSWVYMNVRAFKYPESELTKVVIGLRARVAELEDREAFSIELLLSYATHKYSKGELIELTRDVTDRVVDLRESLSSLEKVSMEDCNISAERAEKAEVRAAELERLADELYYSLRMAEDVGVEEDLMEEEERGTGSEGSYLLLEKRFQEKTPDYQCGGRVVEDQGGEGGS